MYHIGGRTYALIHDHKDGWNPEAFRNRYSEVLERYDYVIGDWGYNQLRLKGFFRDNHPKATRDSSISGMVDYINEYCNFGCAYFVLEKQSGGKRGEDGDDEYIDLDALPAPAEAEEEVAEIAGRTASAADRELLEAEAALQQAAPAAEEKQGPFRQRHQREGRRDFGRAPRREERDQPQGGRKPFARTNPGKDFRDKESGGRGRTNNGTQSTAQQDRADRSGQQPGNQDRPHRPRKPFPAAKAPVAAAAEHLRQQAGTPEPASPEGGGGHNDYSKNNR